MGYFTSLIEKYLPSKNDVHFVQNVPTPLKTLDYKDSERTNSTCEAQFHSVQNVQNVLLRTNRTYCEQAHEAHNVQQNPNVFNTFEPSGTKGQNEHARIEAIARDIDFEEIRYFYQERAAIYEYDAGMPKAEAERLAFQDALVLMIEDNHLEVVQKFKESLLK